MLAFLFLSMPFLQYYRFQHARVLTFGPRRIQLYLSQMARQCTGYTPVPVVAVGLSPLTTFLVVVMMYNLKLPSGEKPLVVVLRLLIFFFKHAVDGH